MSQVITFYSYKGGVGRSMALANVATLLSKWGKKVLMVDWDLEAPGLENFFKEDLQNTDWTQQKGVLEWLYAQQNKEELRWQDLVVSFKTKISTCDLHLLVSGKANGKYSEMLRDFNVSAFYDEHDGGRIIEQFRTELLANYDYILIDSRTGVTDFGGICTIQMPDIVAMFFSPTEQGLSGTKKIAERMLEGREALPFDRFRLLVFPLPSRFDATPEFKESQNWFKKIAAELEFLYDDVLPENANLFEFLQVIKIPYKPYFSFGEKLPVIEEGMADPAGLGYAYENLAMLLGRGLDSVEEFLEKREEYLEVVSGEKTETFGKPISLSNQPVKIYISYVEEDEELVSDFLNRLKQSKVPVFTTTIKKVLPGQSKSKVVADSLEASDLVLLFLSEKYAIQQLNKIHQLWDMKIPDIILAKDFNEYQIIANSDKEFIVPIFLDDLSEWHIEKLHDRHGFHINRTKKSQQKLDVGLVAAELLETIEFIHKEKNNLARFVV